MEGVGRKGDVITAGSVGARPYDGPLDIERKIPENIPLEDTPAPTAEPD